MKAGKSHKEGNVTLAVVTLNQEGMLFEMGDVTLGKEKCWRKWTLHQEGNATLAGGLFFKKG